MKIHVFNPEHDIVLASGQSNFTAPKAGRLLRRDLGFLPALWAKEDEYILVDDVELAERQWRKICSQFFPFLGKERFPFKEKMFLPWEKNISSITEKCVVPWGWDRGLYTRLTRIGLTPDELPPQEYLALIRTFSHRRTAAKLLPNLQMEGTIGESSECKNIDEIDAFLTSHPRVVLKAPWSSSGRGVRFLSTQDTSSATSGLSHSVRNWIVHVLESQGSIMAEPYYNKVEDFALEFYVDEMGKICYEGISLFQTSSGAYIGNIIASEIRKREMISRYVSIDLLDTIQQKIIESIDLKGYHGCFGIDMMIILANDGKYLLHPCVELNLRRTMGHVALALNKHLNPQDDNSFQKVMCIDFNGQNYQLKIE